MARVEGAAEERVGENCVRELEFKFMLLDSKGRLTCVEDEARFAPVVPAPHSGFGLHLAAGRDGVDSAVVEGLRRPGVFEVQHIPALARDLVALAAVAAHGGAGAGAHDEAFEVDFLVRGFEGVDRPCD